MKVAREFFLAGLSEVGSLIRIEDSILATSTYFQLKGEIKLPDGTQLPGALDH